MSLYFRNTLISFTIDAIPFQADNFSYGPIENTIPGHSHATGSYEIHYIPYGYGNLVLPDQTCQVEPNTLYVTGPQVQHAQIPLKEDPMVEYCIYIHTNVMPPASNPNNKFSDLMSLFLSTPFWFGTDQQNIYPLFQTLFEELSNHHIGYICQAESLIRQIIVQIVRNYKQDHIFSNVLENHKPISNPFLLLEETFLMEYDSLTLEALSSHLGLSTRQTQRLLKKQYGQTFLQKRTQARMAAAVSLLSDPSLTLTAIAEKTGYSSVEHFSTVFRKFYNISPKEYRKNNRSK